MPTQGIDNYLSTESEVFTGKSQTETLAYFLLWFCGAVIGPWALRENNTLELVNQSARYIGYKHKQYNNSLIWLLADLS